MSDKVFSVVIGGQAGQGIKSAGLMLAKFAVRSGYQIFNHIEYPSLIRGGHNVMQINISEEAVTGAFNKCDFLIALDQQTVDRHADSLSDGAGVLYNDSGKYDLTKLSAKVKRYPVPLSKIAKEAKGAELVSNTVALGAALGILGGDPKLLLNLIAEEFKGKGEDTSRMNLAAAQIGYEYAATNFSDAEKRLTDRVHGSLPGNGKTILNGNDACALGAIDAGLEFASIYPMSPISPILAVLAEKQEQHHYIYRQPEDEIAAINMAIGASFAGARSMTATSGGGFCLMTEGYGLAGMTETPLVIVEGMRGGPATGLPTWSEQGDLRFILHAHQGEFPKIVLAPGDAKEAYDLTMQAFNLADKYQTPVVVLIDKNICDSDQSFGKVKNGSYKVDRGKLVTQTVPDYRRYKIEQNGISPRAPAGSGNFFIANSDEHDEYGYSTEEIVTRNSQMEKRMNKLETCVKVDVKGPALYGPKNADLTIVSWGSNKGPILESLKSFSNVNFLHLTWISPFPANEIESALKNSKRTLNIECNYSGQMAGLIKEKTGIEIVHNLLKYDGRPFFVEEISDKIKSILKGQFV